MSNIYDTDPTRELTRKPRVPMTPEQLDALRPKPTTQQPVDEAKAIAYRTGVSALEPIIRRIIALERTVAEQAEKIVSLNTRLLDGQESAAAGR